MLSGVTSFSQLLCRAAAADIRLLGSSSSMRSSRSNARMGRLTDRHSNRSVNYISLYLQNSNYQATCTASQN